MKKENTNHQNNPEESEELIRDYKPAFDEYLQMKKDSEKEPSILPPKNDNKATFAEDDPEEEKHTLMEETPEGIPFQSNKKEPKEEEIKSVEDYQMEGVPFSAQRAVEKAKKEKEFEGAPYLKKEGHREGLPYLQEEELDKNVGFQEIESLNNSYKNLVKLSKDKMRLNGLLAKLKLIKKDSAEVEKEWMTASVVYNSAISKIKSRTGEGREEIEKKYLYDKGIVGEIKNLIDKAVAKAQEDSSKKSSPDQMLP